MKKLPLEQKVVEWARDRGILEQGTIEGQLKKLKEEMDELHIAYYTNNREEYVDAIGDCSVVLIILAEMYGVQYTDCLASAYDIISKRKGRMVDGIFVKEE
jgi:NTP pyrophosphatase (non-canonical NTP hydrolase)